MENNRLDLNEFAGRQDHTLTVTPREDPVERDSRLRREEAEAAHQHRKDLALHTLAYAVVAATFALCIYLVLTSPPNGEQNKWAAATLTLIVGSLVGYVTGKAQK